MLRPIHAWALATSLFAVLALAPAAPAQSGGLAAPSPGEGAEPVDPAFKLSARRAVFVGRALRVRGSVSQAAGRTVRIEWLDPAGAWQLATTAQADENGAFAAVWEPNHIGRHELRAVIGGDPAAETGAVQAHAAHSSAPRTVTVYRPARASWYGPGFYGRRTACGTRLTPETLGVAHRRLACGTPVALLHGRRSLVVRVIDRGPYARGVAWDLTGATARRLGVSSTTQLGAAPLG